MHNRIVIVNSTPVIALASIDKLHLLQDLYKTVYIPKAVKDEIFAKPGSKAQKELAKSDEWIQIKQIINNESKKGFRVQLHEGEVEVMVLGEELNADLLIIDDHIAREYAKYLDFRVTGTLGVILRAKESKLITKVKPLIDALMQNGIYIGTKLYDDVLKLADEV